jgi:hypothetical protein
VSYEVLSRLFLEEIEIWEMWEILLGDLHATVRLNSKPQLARSRVPR